MHILGLRGHAAPRLHLPGRAWAGTALNLLATLGAMLIAAERAACSSSTSVRSLRRGAPAGDNPVGRAARSSGRPPRRRRLQLRRASRSSRGREPLWEPRREALPVVTGLRVDEREVLVTTRARRRAPTSASLRPSPTLWPFLARCRDHDPVHRLDLHAVGRRLGRDPGGHRADRLVLAARAARSAAPVAQRPPPRARAALAGMKRPARRSTSRRCRPRLRPPQPDVVGHARLHGDRRHGLRAGDRRLLLPAQPCRALAARQHPAARPALGHAATPRVLLASALPNHWAKQRRAAPGPARRRTSGWASCLLLGVAAPRPARLRVHRAQRPLGQQRLRLDRLGAARPAHHAPRHRRLRHRRPARRPASRPARRPRASPTSPRTRSTGTSSCSRWLPIYAVLYLVPRLS